MSIANTVIRIRKSQASGNAPSFLANGEIAINQADGRLFYAKPSGETAYITNQQSFATVNANSSLLLASSGSDILSLIPGNNISISACTVNKSITFAMPDELYVANVVVPTLYTTSGGIVFPDGSVQVTSSSGAATDAIARSMASSAQANTIYLQNVNNTQNTRLSTVEANTIYLFGALNQTNTNIVSANTQLKNYTDGLVSYISGVDNTQNNRLSIVESTSQSAYDKANAAYDAAGADLTALTANVIYLQGVDNSQNTRLTGVENTNVYLQGALNQTNTNIVNANTQLKSYTDGKITDTLNYVSGIDNSQNTRISIVESTSQSAYDKANAAYDAAGADLSALTANVEYLLGIENSQNTRISTVEANTIYLFDALDQTNTNIVSANTQLKSYVDGKFYQKTGGTISGPVTITSNLSVSGIIQTNYNILSSGNVVAPSANTTIDSFDNTSIRSAKYIIQITDSTGYHATELRLMQNGSDAFFTQYGDIYDVSYLGNFYANVSSNITTLYFTPTNSSAKVLYSRDAIVI